MSDSPTKVYKLKKLIFFAASEKNISANGVIFATFNLMIWTIHATRFVYDVTRPDRINWVLDQVNPSPTVTVLCRIWINRQDIKSNTLSTWMRKKVENKQAFLLLCIKYYSLTANQLYKFNRLVQLVVDDVCIIHFMVHNVRITVQQLKQTFYLTLTRLLNHIIFML